MAHIEIIPYEKAKGELKEIYDHLIDTRGKLAEVHKVQSLNPRTILKHMDLYMEIMYGKSPLKRVQREIVATVVSVTNKCTYCIEHHAEAVQYYWKNEERLEALKQDYRSAKLLKSEDALCNYAELLTLSPEKTKDGEEVEKLKRHGWSERQILDTTLVVAYFNFVNRIVLSLGLDIEEDGAAGYDYE